MEKETQRTFTLKAGGTVVAEGFDSAEEMAEAFPVRISLLETERETVSTANPRTFLFEEHAGAKTCVAYIFDASENSGKLFVRILLAIGRYAAEERKQEPQGGAGNSGGPLVPAQGVPQVLPKKEKQPPIWQQKVREKQEMTA